MHRSLIFSLKILLVYCILRMSYAENFLKFGVPVDGVISSGNNTFLGIVDLNPSDDPKGDTVFVLYVNVIVQAPVSSSDIQLYASSYSQVNGSAVAATLFRTFTPALGTNQSWTEIILIVPQVSSGVWYLFLILQTQNAANLSLPFTLSAHFCVQYPLRFEQTIYHLFDYFETVVLFTISGDQFAKLFALGESYSYLYAISVSPLRIFFKQGEFATSHFYDYRAIESRVPNNTDTKRRRFEILILDADISPLDTYVLVERNYSMVLEQTSFTLTLKQLHGNATFSAVSLTLVILFAFIAAVSIATVVVLLVNIIRKKRATEVSTTKDNGQIEYQQLKD
jgi:hypothetical protein